MTVGEEIFTGSKAIIDKKRKVYSPDMKIIAKYQKARDAFFNQYSDITEEEKMSLTIEFRKAYEVLKGKALPENADQNFQFFKDQRTRKLNIQKDKFDVYFL